MSTATATDWATFPCHWIEDGKCSCERANCHSPGKHPLTSNGLHDATRDPTILDEWRRRWPKSNWAIPTGEVNGLVVIDIDPAHGGWDSLLEIEARHGHFPETVEVDTGGGGLHLYFRAPEGVKIGSRNGWFLGIDVKAEGGYVVAPGSNHKSGGTYAYRDGCSPDDIELADVTQWMLDILPRKDEPRREPEPHHVNGSMNGHATLLQRAQAYTARAAAACEGGRNDAAFRLAGHLAAFSDGGLRLGEREIVSLMWPWNQRCNPPLSDNELQQAAASALRNGKPRESKGMPDLRPPELREEPIPPIQKTTFAQLHANHPRLHEPVIEGLLRQGETCNLISNPKRGKSWTAYGMALSVLDARPWLGHFPTVRGPVLIVDNELHAATLAHRIPVVAVQMQVHPDTYTTDLHIVSLRGNLHSLADVEDWAVKTVQPGQYKLIILDAMYRFCIDGVSENDNSAMAAFYNRLDRIAAHTQAAIVVIHHASKGSQGEKRVTDVGSGAGAQSRAADCHLVLREHEEDGAVVLDAAVRSFPPVEPLGLRWQFPLWIPDSGVDPAMLKGKQTAGEQRQAERDQQGTNKIIDSLLKWTAEDGQATAQNCERKPNSARTGFKNCSTS